MTDADAVDDWLRPDWPAPAHVRALVTTREGGVSRDAYASLNLGAHVGDDPAAVAENRRRLVEAAALPAEPIWLSQVHGLGVAKLAADSKPGIEADAAMTDSPGVVCAVLTADCLPVLFCDRLGTRVATAHAGWRGLAGGILEASVEAMDTPPEDLHAWLGPAIGPAAFEVGDEVREAFVARHPAANTAFIPSPAGRWLADLYTLARLRLAACGVRSVHGGGECTFTDAQRFYSYRRDGDTGRMASLVWIQH
jgi:polyphenol oxidase